jgi:hypothetical protein
MQFKGCVLFLPMNEGHASVKNYAWSTRTQLPQMTLHPPRLQQQIWQPVERMYS